MRETIHLAVERDVAVAMRDGTVLMPTSTAPAPEAATPCSCSARPTTRRCRGLASSSPTHAGPAPRLRRRHPGHAAAATPRKASSTPSCRRSPTATTPSSGAARQPWSDGNVGMYGDVLRRRDAVAGRHRRAAAPARHRPDLTASDYYEGWTYQGGAFELGLQLLTGCLAGLTPANFAHARRPAGRTRRVARPSSMRWPSTHVRRRSETAAARATCRRSAEPARRTTPTGWPTPTTTSTGGSRRIEDRHDQSTCPRLQHRRLVRHLPRRDAAQLHRRARRRDRRGGARASA